MWSHTYWTPTGAPRFRFCQQAGLRVQACWAGRDWCGQALAALPDRHTVRPVVSHVLPLTAAAQAGRMLAVRHADGKVVLDVIGG